MTIPYENIEKFLIKQDKYFANKERIKRIAIIKEKIKELEIKLNQLK